MRYCFCFLLVILCFPGKLYAQNDLDVVKHWIQFSDASNSLYHHLADEAYKLLDDRSKKVHALRTLDAWKDYQKSVRKKLQDVVGPFPEKTPLNAKIVSTVTRDNYKVEDIIFESQPGCDLISVHPCAPTRQR